MGKYKITATDYLGNRHEFALDTAISQFDDTGCDLLYYESIGDYLYVVAFGIDEDTGVVSDWPCVVDIYDHNGMYPYADFDCERAD